MAERSAYEAEATSKRSLGATVKTLDFIEGQ